VAARTWSRVIITGAWWQQEHGHMLLKQMLGGSMSSPLRTYPYRTWSRDT